MKIKVLFLTFALALTAWAQTETKNSTPAPAKKSCCGSAMSCCGGMKDSKDGKMKCDMADRDMTAHKEAKDAKSSTDTKDAKGCCGDKCPMHGDHNHAAHSGN